MMETKTTYKPKTVRFYFWHRKWSNRLEWSSLFHDIRISTDYDKAYLLYQIFKFKLDLSITSRLFRAFPIIDHIHGELNPEWEYKKMAGLGLKVQALGIYFSFDLTPIPIPAEE